jgi:hypothetical protein
MYKVGDIIRTDHDCGGMRWRVTRTDSDGFDIGICRTDTGETIKETKDVKQSETWTYKTCKHLMLDPELNKLIFEF